MKKFILVPALALVAAGFLGGCANSPTTPPGEIKSTYTPIEEVAKLLPKNASDLRIYRGNFDGDGYEDFVVYFELKNVVIDKGGNMADKQYLRTYLYDVGAKKYEQKREDEGLPGWSWGISEVKVVDFDRNGIDEVYVLKIMDGTGAFKGYYVMGEKGGEMVDLPIDKETKLLSYRSHHPNNLEI